MKPNNINLFITPKVAANLAKLYYNLNTNPEENRSELQDLELRLREISEFNHWEFKQVQEIVDHLVFIASTADEQDRTAAVPPNLEELVETYIKYEEQLAQPKTNQVQQQIDRYKQQLEKEKAVLARLSPQERLSTEKVIQKQSGEVYSQKESSVATLEKPSQEENLVRDIPESRFIRPVSPPKDEEKTEQSSEPLEPKKEQIKTFVEQAQRAARIQMMATALKKANVPEKYADPIAEKIQTLADGGTIKEDAVKEAQFSQEVSDAIQEAFEQTIKETDSLDKTLIHSIKHCLPLNLKKLSKQLLKKQQNNCLKLPLF
jgi:hypothetical protein